jgi:uncharacterized protein (TIGR03437 family)
VQIVDGVAQSTLGGYQLTIGGVAAPLLYLSANQINAVVPNEVAGQESVPVSLVTPNGTFQLADLGVRPSEPEIFTNPGTGFAVAINQNNQLNSASNPAHAGEIVSIWATGSGAPGNLAAPPDGTIINASVPFVFHTPAQPVAVFVADPSLPNDSLEVDYAGDAPNEVFGATQVNFRLPPSFPAGFSALPVRLQVGTATSTAVNLYVAP